MGRIRAPLAASALLAVGACALGACSNPDTPASSGSTTSSTSTTSPTTTTTSVPSTTAPLPTCQVSSLRVALVGSQGAAGTEELTFGLSNTSASPCATYGYPGMLLVDANGAPLPTTVDRGGDLSFESVPPAALRLAPGQTAYFNAGFNDVQGGNSACPSPRSIEVTPPTNTTHASVAAPAGMLVCQDGTLHVSAVFASSDAAATQTTAA